MGERAQVVIARTRARRTQTDRSGVGMTNGRVHSSGRTRQRGAAGLSLVELLVVLGIIGLISAVLVPFAVRNGWFTASKSAFAARELFTMLKAASVYAGTYNVDTAVAYAGRLVDDSETGVEDVPVADRLVLARRLSREEITALIEAGVALQFNAELYVPVLGPEGVFRPLPNQTCILPDLFEVELNTTTNQYVSITGLRGVQLFDLDTQTLIEPRAGLDYALDGTLALSFPAHVFKADGSMIVPAGHRQRFRVRAGVMPDQEFTDRFYVDPQGPPMELRPIQVVFDKFDTDGTSPIMTDTFYSANPEDDPENTGIEPFADIDAEVEFFVATGRVRMLE